ncbi:4'-phosphopantetheinyl transferase superfamily protein [Dyella sp. BiH032]|uniref:4'-phosphopantetheinyl transferase family protein n=1 Tax=Dyella sp. BiH032 TaxID=3075430 RepID=UPI002892DEE9|nr:4'-phosphopantetheinyl transferase superfamily protein [Dyella sp. BiH032]WNL46239.1 4'-phosphopantetheinyl transferase superfamily protein [Dyella sp. BiH032]
MTTTHGQVPAKVAEHLRDDEIHVWRMAYDHHQGRSPFRVLLAAYVGCPVEQVQLESGEFGRPRLVGAGAGGLHFNWSHSGDRALFAVARGVEPGVDLERLRPRPRALAIAERYFSHQEAAALAALAPERRDTAFLQLWTAKEAVLKATGRGLAFGLHRLHIEHAEERLALRFLDGELPADWQLHRLEVDAWHVGSLAWRGGPRTIRLRTLAPAAG